MSELTIQSMTHAATMPTKYFGDTASVSGGTSLLHTKYVNPSHLVQVPKVTWNPSPGGTCGATTLPRTASRSMSGTAPNSVGHCIVPKKHKALAAGYIVDARSPGDAARACRIDAMTWVAYRMSEDSDVQGCVDSSNKIEMAGNWFQT